MTYHKIPAVFHWTLWPATRLLRFLNALRLDVWVVTGEEAGSKKQLAIIYAGGVENKNFWNALIFDSSYRENYIGKVWVWKILETAKNRGYFCSLVIREMPKVFRILFEKGNSFYIPCWVLGEVDISADIFSRIRNKSLESDIRRIKNNKLCYELTDELPKFHYFYYHMYLPYITKTHGNRAIIMKYDFVKKQFRNCDLLLVKKEKEYIAGILLTYKKNGASLWFLGVKDGNSDYVRDGAIGALIYFSVKHLKGKGYAKVGFGASRAFLKDGVLRYKKKWNLQVVQTSGTGFSLKLLSKTAGIKDFLLNNPFIYINNQGLNGAIFVDSGQSFSKKDCEKIYKDYHIAGISKLVIYQFGKDYTAMQNIVYSAFSTMMEIRSADSLFQKITALTQK